MLKIEDKDIFFAGASYALYPFKLYPLDADLPDIGAVYIFMKVGDGFYEPLYIAQTDTLISCLKYHEKWVCVNRYFVNAICVYFGNDATTRIQIERDLINLHQPLCNDL